MDCADNHVRQEQVRHNEKKKPDKDGFYKDKPQARQIIDPINDFTNQRKKKVQQYLLF